MTVTELAERMGLTVLALPAPERCVTGGYCGDLLSWVMGRAAADSAWITIMSNRNVAAVASLSDTACVILAEGVTPDAELLDAALNRGINLLGGGGSVYALAVRLGALLE